MYCSFEVSIPPAAMVTLLLVLIGAPVVFRRSIVPPELDLTKFVLLPFPTVYWQRTLSHVVALVVEAV